MELRFIKLTAKAVEAGNWDIRTYTHPVDDLGYTNVDRVSIRGFKLRLQTCFPVKKLRIEHTGRLQGSEVQG